MKTQGVELVTGAAQAAFWTEFNALPDRIGELAFNVPTDQKIETYAWLGDSPNVREWVGSRIQKSVPEQSFTITNKLYESTLNVDYFTHQSAAGAAQVQARSRQMAQKVGSHGYRLLLDLLEDTTSTCYDGLTFFNDSHFDAGAGYVTTQDNNIGYNASSTTAPTGWDMVAAFDTCMVHWLTVRDSEGDLAFGDVYEALKPTFIVPAGYASASLKAMKNDIVYDDSGNPHGNPLVGAIDVIVAPTLTVPGTSPVFYGLLVGSPRYPFIYQVHTAANLDDNAAEVLNGNVSDLSIRAAIAHSVGYGDWRPAVKLTVS